MSARVLRMTDKARAGNRRRVNKWRGSHREAYNEYMRKYRSLRSVIHEKTK